MFQKKKEIKNIINPLLHFLREGYILTNVLYRFKASNFKSLKRISVSEKEHHKYNYSYI